MRVITRKGKAAKAASKWKKQYLASDKGPWLFLPSFPGRDRTQETYDQLVALGNAPDPDDVDRITNVKWFTEICCDECGDAQPVAVVEIGEPIEYESRTARICLECLSRAITLARANTQGGDTGNTPQGDTGSTLQDEWAEIVDRRNALEGPRVGRIEN